MRIVGGTLSGRRFAGPTGSGTRPTSERVREGLSSALDSRDLFHGRRVLDLFAGTGALAFEALSREATSAVLVDRDRQLVKALDKSAAELGLRERCHTVALDLLGRGAARKLRERCDGSFGLVFVDPPYAKIEQIPPLLDALLDEGVIDASAAIVIEHAKRLAPSDLGKLALTASYKYGDTVVLLTTPEPELLP